MADIKWIKLSTLMFDDEKIKLIEAMPDRDTILIVWVKLLAQAGKCNASGYLLLNQSIPYTDEMLSTIFNRPLNTVRMALEVFKQFGMIDIEDVTLHISNWEKHQNIEGMDKIREQNRERKRRQREKEKQLLIEEKSHVTVTGSHSEITQQNKNKNKNKENIYCAFFENLWNLYPKKRGKNYVTKKALEEINKIGIEEMTRAIERYKSEILRNKTDEKYIKNGSTFFNGGYEYYLDKSYQDDKPTEIPPNPEYLRLKQQLEGGNIVTS